jgi:hypothetical protein
MPHGCYVSSSTVSWELGTIPQQETTLERDRHDKQEVDIDATRAR